MDVRSRHFVLGYSGLFNLIEKSKNWKKEKKDKILGMYK